MLAVASLTEVAAATGETSLAEKSLLLLEPYAGRGVVNGGGVAFVGVVDDYLHQACTLLGRDDDARGWAASAAHAYENMGASWWLRRFSAPTSTPGRSDVVHLRPGGEGIWWVGREGAVTPLRDVKGLHYLRLVLARPGVGVSAVDLSDAVAGHPGTGPVGVSAGELLDRQALDSYRRRLAEIDNELDEAASWSDSGRVAKLEDERDVLLRELRTAVGLGGRHRTSGATNERARVAVRKAITTAIHHVSTVDPSLGRLLSDRISTGSTCRYDPDPDRPTQWVLS